MPPTETPTSQESQFQPSSPETNREALYQQYYGTPTGDTPPADATPTPVESAAPAEPVEAPVTPPVATLPPEAYQFMQQMTAELAELRAKLTPTAPTVTAAPESEPSWVALLREGRVKEAEDALAASVAAKNQNQLVQQALQQTREVMRAEADVDNFTTGLRTANPELVPMEGWIASEAQKIMFNARQQGLIKTTDDAVRTYKSAVTEAVTSARKLYLAIRGDGKQEAQIRSREVLSSRPVPPQQTDTSRPQVNGVDAQEAPVETASSYIENRKAIEAWKKGLAPKPNFL